MMTWPGTLGERDRRCAMYTRVVENREEHPGRRPLRARPKYTAEKGSFVVKAEIGTRGQIKRIEIS